MLEKKQEIGNAAGAALLDEGALERQRIPIPNDPQATDFEGTHVLKRVSYGSTGPLGPQARA